jgi:phage N-6-adenine-methyltransferase
MVSDTLFSSDSIEWETPQWLFDLLDDRYHFSLDVCATKENAKCWNYYTEQDNGLKRKWSGVCWCNPPYGREIGDWVDRAAQQIKYKRVQWIVMLLPCRTDTKWWHRSVQPAALSIRFIEGRLKFVGAAGAAPFPSVIAVYHRNRRTSGYLTIGPSINARGRS